MSQRAFACLMAVSGCSAPAATSTPTNTDAQGRSEEQAAIGPVRSTTARDKGLEVWFEIRPDAPTDGAGTRKVLLHFRNASNEPVRIYLPQEQAFRAHISTLVMRTGDATLLVPEPQPHGYVVTEVDFPLLAPGEERSFVQPFALDAVQPGPDPTPARRKGFEPRRPVKITWSYANDIVRWPGGVGTLDGPTKALFGGKDIPHIWTGKLSVDATWTAP